MIQSGTVPLPQASELQNRSVTPSATISGSLLSGRRI
jgi:hypothetical protein